MKQKKFTNKDLKEELFGEKKRSSKFGEGDPSINFLNGKPFSQKFYELIEIRKSLPAW